MITCGKPTNGPSKKWTSQERLKVVGRLAEEIMKLYRHASPPNTSEIFDLAQRIVQVSFDSANNLEAHRREIVRGLTEQEIRLTPRRLS